MFEFCLHNQFQLPFFVVVVDSILLCSFFSHPHTETNMGEGKTEKEKEISLENVCFVLQY